MKQTLMVPALLLCSAALPGSTANALTVQDTGRARDCLEPGSADYLKHDFQRAIPLSQRALDLEKEHPTLDKTLGKVLVDSYYKTQNSWKP